MAGSRLCRAGVRDAECLLIFEVWIILIWDFFRTFVIDIEY